MNAILPDITLKPSELKALELAAKLGICVELHRRGLLTEAELAVLSDKYRVGLPS